MSTGSSSGNEGPTVTPTTASTIVIVPLTPSAWNEAFATEAQHNVLGDRRLSVGVPTWVGPISNMSTLSYDRGPQRPPAGEALRSIAVALLPVFETLHGISRHLLFVYPLVDWLQGSTAASSLPSPLFTGLLVILAPAMNRGAPQFTLFQLGYRAANGTRSNGNRGPLIGVVTRFIVETSHVMVDEGHGNAGTFLNAMLAETMLGVSETMTLTLSQRQSLSEADREAAVTAALVETMRRSTVLARYVEQALASAELERQGRAIDTEIDVLEAVQRVWRRMRAHQQQPATLSSLRGSDERSVITPRSASSALAFALQRGRDFNAAADVMEVIYGTALPRISIMPVEEHQNREWYGTIADTEYGTITAPRKHSAYTFLHSVIAAMTLLRSFVHDYRSVLPSFIVIVSEPDGDEDDVIDESFDDSDEDTIECDEFGNVTPRTSLSSETVRNGSERKYGLLIANMRDLTVVLVQRALTLQQLYTRYLLMRNDTAEDEARFDTDPDYAPFGVPIGFKRQRRPSSERVAKPSDDEFARLMPYDIEALLRDSRAVERGRLIAPFVEHVYHYDQGRPGNVGLLQGIGMLLLGAGRAQISDPTDARAIERVIDALAPSMRQYVDAATSLYTLEQQISPCPAAQEMRSLSDFAADDDDDNNGACGSDDTTMQTNNRAKQETTVASGVKRRRGSGGTTIGRPRDDDDDDESTREETRFVNEITAALTQLVDAPTDEHRATLQTVVGAFMKSDARFVLQYSKRSVIAAYPRLDRLFDFQHTMCSDSRTKTWATLNALRVKRQRLETRIATLALEFTSEDKIARMMRQIDASDRIKRIDALVARIEAAVPQRAYETAWSRLGQALDRIATHPTFIRQAVPRMFAMERDKVQLRDGSEIERSFAARALARAIDYASKEAAERGYCDPPVSVATLGYIQAQRMLDKWARAADNPCNNVVVANPLRHLYGARRPGDQVMAGILLPPSAGVPQRLIGRYLHWRRDATQPFEHCRADNLPPNIVLSGTASMRVARARSPVYQSNAKVLQLYDDPPHTPLPLLNMQSLHRSGNLLRTQLTSRDLQLGDNIDDDVDLSNSASTYRRAHREQPDYRVEAMVEWLIDEEREARPSPFAAFNSPTRTSPRSAQSMLALGGFPTECPTETVVAVDMAFLHAVHHFGAMTAVFHAARQTPYETYRRDHYAEVRTEVLDNVDARDMADEDDDAPQPGEQWHIAPHRLEEQITEQLLDGSQQLPLGPLSVYFYRDFVALRSELARRVLGDVDVLFVRVFGTLEMYLSGAADAKPLDYYLLRYMFKAQVVRTALTRAPTDGDNQSPLAEQPFVLMVMRDLLNPLHQSLYQGEAVHMDELIVKFNGDIEQLQAVLGAPRNTFIDSLTTESDTRREVDSALTSFSIRAALLLPRLPSPSSSSSSSSSGSSEQIDNNDDNDGTMLQVNV